MKLKVAIVQMTSVLDFQVNLDKARDFCQQALDQGAEAIFFPEVFYSMAGGERTPHLVQGENEHFKNIKSLATDFGLHFIGGTAAAVGAGEIRNRSLNFSKQGRELGIYDKIHLFKCDTDQVKLDESEVYCPGEDYHVVNLENWKIGQSICFDLRFAEMAGHYRKKGCHILTYPSAFTVPTGKAHWEILLRARAIENQVYVIAPAQWGKNNEKIETYGHSMIIDPWGDIIAIIEEGEGIAVAELDTDVIDQARRRIVMS